MHGTSCFYRSMSYRRAHAHTYAHTHTMEEREREREREGEGRGVHYSFNTNRLEEWSPQKCRTVSDTYPTASLSPPITQPSRLSEGGTQICRALRSLIVTRPHRVGSTQLLISVDKPGYQLAPNLWPTATVLVIWLLWRQSHDQLASSLPTEAINKHHCCTVPPYPHCGLGCTWLVWDTELKHWHQKTIPPRHHKPHLQNNLRHFREDLIASITHKSS